MPHSYTCEHCQETLPNKEAAFYGTINEEWFDNARLGSEIEETMGRTPEETLALCPTCLFILLEDV